MSHTAILWMSAGTSTVLSAWSVTVIVSAVSVVSAASSQPPPPHAANDIIVIASTIISTMSFNVLFFLLRNLFIIRTLL
jgi:hypothetical protein